MDTQQILVMRDYIFHKVKGESYSNSDLVTNNMWVLNAKTRQEIFKFEQHLQLHFTHYFEAPFEVSKWICQLDMQCERREEAG